MSANGIIARRLAACIAIGIAIGWGATVQGGAPGDKGTRKESAPAAEPAKKLTQTRVFTPKHTDPAEVLQAIDMLLDSVAGLDHPPAMGLQGLSGLPGGLPGGQGQLGGIGGGLGGLGQLGGIGGGLGGFGGAQGGFGLLGGVQGGVPGAGGAQLGGIGFGGFAGMIGGPGGPAPHAARLALDKRTGSVIIHGPEKEVQIASDLVKLLDNPADKPLPEVKSLRAFPLKHTKASNIASLAGELEIGVALLPLDEAKLLVAVGPPEAVRELVELVTALDAAAEKRPDTERRRKLFSPDQENPKQSAQ